MNTPYDLFISHASEDKEAIARPLANELRFAGLEVWYDEFTIHAGDSINEQISYGLANSQHGILILSHNFFHPDKTWTRLELNGFVPQIARGSMLFIWHDLELEDVRSYAPILADRLAIKSNRNIGSTVLEVLKVLGYEAAACTWRGRKYIYEGNFRRAEGELQRAIHLDEDNLLARTLLANAYNYMGDKVKAQQIAEHILSIDPRPNSSADWVARCSAFSHFPNTVQEQIHCCREALHIQPQNVRALINLATSLADLGDIRHAYLELEEAERIDPYEPNISLARMRIALAEKNYEFVVSLADICLEAAPGFAYLIFYNKGFAQSLLGDIDGGLESLTQSIQHIPHDYVFAWRALLNVDARNFHDAIRDANEAIRLGGEGSVVPYHAKAEAYLRLGKRIEARQNAEQALAIDPNHQGALNVLNQV